MPKARAHAAAFGGTPDEVEASFYEALQSADIEKLMSCWAEDDDIVCIHPGGPRIVGAGAIRAAFDAIFAHEGSIHVHPEAIRRVEDQFLAQSVTDRTGTLGRIEGEMLCGRRLINPPGSTALRG